MRVDSVPLFVEYKKFMSIYNGLTSAFWVFSGAAGGG